MWIYTITVLLIIVQCFYLWIKRRYSFFKNIGVSQVEPQFPYGNIKTLNKTESIGELTARFYNEMKGKSPIAGFYSFIFPILLVTDIELLKKILVRDFNYFMNRGVYYNEKDDPLSAHLFSMDGDGWKNMRKKLSPTFSSGKMKFMFSTIVAVSNEFTKCVDNEIKVTHEIEMKEILSRFTTDVIGSCAFGLECNSLKEPNSIFREMGRKVFSGDPLSAFQRGLISTYPDLGRKLGIATVRPEVAEFFIKCVKDTVEYRKKNNIQKNDFLNLLLDIGKENSDEELSINEIAAQAFVFFLAGFETSSTTMSYAMYELALNQEIQQKARDEITSVLKRHDDKMTYEAIMEMKYIENIIDESLRKYPPGTILLRRVTKDYKVDDTNIILKKGMRLMIPVYGIHHDPEFYPKPDVFDPNRFSDEEKQKRNPYAFLAFGEGPRNCIGLRFGMMQARIGLASLLSNFKFTMNDKTEQPLTFSPKGFVLTINGGLFLNVERI